MMPFWAGTPRRGGHGRDRAWRTACFPRGRWAAAMVARIHRHDPRDRPRRPNPLPRHARGYGLRLRAQGGPRNWAALDAVSLPRGNTLATPSHSHTTGDDHMRLGNFSVSLAVKDIAASRAFYEKLGFQVIGGDQAHNWLIPDVRGRRVFNGARKPFAARSRREPCPDRSACSQPAEVNRVQRTANRAGPKQTGRVPTDSRFRRRADLEPPAPSSANDWRPPRPRKRL